MADKSQFIAGELIGLLRSEVHDTLLLTIRLCLISRKDTEHLLSDQSSISKPGPGNPASGSLGAMSQHRFPPAEPDWSGAKEAS